MTRPTIDAILDDGPRAGETVRLDVGHEDEPPNGFLLADDHLGVRPAGQPVHPPSGSVSTYRLVGRDGQGSGYRYRVVSRASCAIRRHPARWGGVMADCRDGADHRVWRVACAAPMPVRPP